VFLFCSEVKSRRHSVDAFQPTARVCEKIEHEWMTSDPPRLAMAGHAGDSVPMCDADATDREDDRKTFPDPIGRFRYAGAKIVQSTH
jgi:hypothetical protein